jgi:hypothetical protein
VKLKFYLSAGVFLIVLHAHGQGTIFVNLDFESAALQSTTPSPTPGVPTVDIAEALPGWSAFIGTNPVTKVMYNNQTLDTSSIALLSFDYFGSARVIDDVYSVFFLAGRGGNGSGSLLNTDTRLYQTGFIPANAASLRFKAKEVVFPATFVVSLDQQSLSVMPLQTTAEYTLFGVDVTSFRGQTKELSFTIPSIGVGRGFVLDSISFSDQAIPEPSVIGLFLVGALLLGRRVKRKAA